MEVSQYFPAEAVHLPDDKLGILLFGAVVLTKADDLGLPHEEIGAEFEDKVRAAIIAAESDTADLAAVEKALHKAARGDFATAGRLIREYLVNGAVHMKAVPIGLKRLRQSRAWGEKGAADSRRKGACNRNRVLEACDETLAKRTRHPTDRQLAALVAPKVGLAEPTVRAHIRELRKVKLLD